MGGVRWVGCGGWGAVGGWGTVAEWVGRGG